MRYHIETEACPECGAEADTFHVNYMGVWVCDDGVGRRRVVVSCTKCDYAWVDTPTQAPWGAVGRWEFPPENGSDSCAP